MCDERAINQMLAKCEALTFDERAIARSACASPSSVCRRSSAVGAAGRPRSTGSASPLTVGNGEFGFTADVTGLQTLNATYAFFPPLQTMSHWGWHKIPAALTDVNPPSYHYERVTVGAHTAEWQQCRRWLRRFRAHRRAGPTCRVLCAAGTIALRRW